MARKVQAQISYPVAMICSTLGISRSGYYYQGCSHDESQLVSSIKAVQARFPTYGTRRVTAELKREPEKIHVNRKRVQRLMRQYDFLQPLDSSSKCNFTNRKKTVSLSQANMSDTDQSKGAQCQPTNSLPVNKDTR